MATEALSSTEMLDFIRYDTISAIPYSCNDSSDTNFLLEKHDEYFAASLNGASLLTPRRSSVGLQNLAVQGRKKRRRRPKVCKNKEDAETQRMTHITVERNRRKQMNEHLAVLRSLMSESYVQRGDQASIVGGAIDFVKELEHILQSLEAQKFQLLQEEGRRRFDGIETTALLSSAASSPTPFAQFFAQPQYYMSSCSTQSTTPNKYYNYRCSNNGGIAEIEVSLVETHANIRVLSPKRLRQLSKLVAAFHNLYLTILHLNVTTLDPLVLYSISTKVEEGCQLNSADDIAGAVHHMLRIIEEEAMPLPYVDDHDLPP